MKTTVSKSWSFDAAHQLENHNGKCRRPHGHTYTLTVGVEGDPQPIDGRPQEGMVVDFELLDQVWKELKPHLDHRDLNESTKAWLPVTTSEHLAAFCLNYFRQALPDRQVTFARVSETQSTYAEVR